MVNQNLTPLFYETLRNRYNMSKVLRKNDCIYDTHTKTTWKLTENANKSGIALSSCVSSEDKNIRIGEIKLKCFFNESGVLKSNYKRT